MGSNAVHACAGLGHHPPLLPGWWPVCCSVLVAVACRGLSSSLSISQSSLRTCVQTSFSHKQHSNTNTSLPKQAQASWFRQSSPFCTQCRQATLKAPQTIVSPLGSAKSCLVYSLPREEPSTFSTSTCLSSLTPSAHHPWCSRISGDNQPQRQQRSFSSPPVKLLSACLLSDVFHSLRNVVNAARGLQVFCCL